MNLKSFLERNFSWILYFLARKNSGKGSVPHSIWKIPEEDLYQQHLKNSRIGSVPHSIWKIPERICTTQYLKENNLRMGQNLSVHSWKYNLKWSSVSVRLSLCCHFLLMKYFTVATKTEKNLKPLRVCLVGVLLHKSTSVHISHTKIV